MATDVRLRVVTWNVGDSAPPEDLTPLLQLDRQPLPSVYAVGLQEIKSTPVQFTVDAVFDDEWTNKLTSVLAEHGYARVNSIRLLTMHLAVFVQREKLTVTSHIEASYNRTGFGGLLGNKGAVSVRMRIHGVTVCFVNCHFQAHMKNVKARLQDYKQVISSHVYKDPEAAKILDHDYVVWFGDLNFRIEKFTRAELLTMIKDKEFKTLHKFDQLNTEIKKGTILENFSEGTLKFKPTYKYDFGTHEYDSSKKQRKPAWCDRILWKVKDGKRNHVRLSAKQLSYTDVPQYTNSDHKPVISELTIMALVRPPSVPVSFAPVAGWRMKQDGECSYNLDRQVALSSWDWIGLYKENFKHGRDYVTYEWVQDTSPPTEGSSSQRRAKFQGSTLRVAPGTYYLGYFSSLTGAVSGYSKPFKIAS